MMFLKKCRILHPADMDNAVEALGIPAFIQNSPYFIWVQAGMKNIQTTICHPNLINNPKTPAKIF